MSELNKRPITAIVAAAQLVAQGLLAHLHLDKDFAERLAASQQLKGENRKTVKPSFSELDS